MKKLTAIALAITISVSALFAQEQNLESFRKGYQAGTHVLQSQFEAQGWRQKEVIFKNYIVALAIKNLAVNDIAYICDLGRNNGYNPIVTKGAIVFGDYERKADAEYNSKYINKTIKVKSYAQSAKNKKFYTYPLFKNIYKQMEDDIKTSNNVMVVTQYSNKVKTIVKKCPKRKPAGRKVSYFRINADVVQGYAKKEDSFIPVRVYKDNDQLYKKGKITKGKNGAFYVKVYNKNLYFRSKKVKIMNIYI